MIKIVAKNALVVILLVVLWAMLFLPNVGAIRELKYEEGRRALQAESMLEQGHFVVPAVCARPYIYKPPMLAWLITLAAYIIGELNELAVRLPSLLSVLLTGLLIFIFVKKYTSTVQAFFAALIFFTTPIVLRCGALGETDAFTMGVSFIALLYWWAKYSSGQLNAKQWLVTGALLSLGVLAKGPYAAVYLCSAIFFLFLLHKNYRQLTNLVLCIVVSIAPVLVWAALAYKQEYIQVWIEQIFRMHNYQGLRAYLSQHLYSVKEILLTYFPWIIIAGLVLSYKLLRRKDPNFNLYRFLGIYVFIGSLVVFLVPSIRPRYLIPIAPALAVIIGLSLGPPKKSIKSGLKYLTVVCFIILVIALQMKYLLVEVPYDQKNIRHWPQDGETISALVPEGKTIYKLSEGFYNLIFYVDRPVVEIKPSVFFDKIQHGYVLIETGDFQPKPFVFSTLLGSFKYGGWDILLLRIRTGKNKEE